MIGIAIRGLLFWALFQGLGYSMRYPHVDALVPGSCLPVTQRAEAMGSGCLYRDVTATGSVATRSYDVQMPEGQVLVVEKMPALLGKQSPGEATLQTYGLFALMLLIAAADILPWLLRGLRGASRAQAT
ncbi:hypothetical protein [Cupriavidus pampae]|uniref:DUF3592 domain-containing protein n=1 Tax=Cupriavidus pampae TaxID=659251 RepID=A0ABM8XU20_9BURK|nr:hypothetical protein [Cupriavidus pampae]CAG9183817.1 hypothetical protein LMG32289_05430 [Cupriavidus pampae]